MERARERKTVRKRKLYFTCKLLDSCSYTFLRACSLLSRSLEAIKTPEQTLTRLQLQEEQGWRQLSWMAVGGSCLFSNHRSTNIYAQSFNNGGTFWEMHHWAILSLCEHHVTGHTHTNLDVQPITYPGCVLQPVGILLLGCKPVQNVPILNTVVNYNPLISICISKHM